MAKISTITEWLDHGDQKTKVEFEVHYKTGVGFMGRIPAKYWDLVAMMSDADISTYYVRREFASKYNPKQGFKSVSIYADAEGTAVERTKTLLKKFLSSVTTRRQVIIITYKGEVSNYRNGEKYNEEHKPVSIEFALKYCTEIAVEGQEKQYAVFYMYVSPFSGDDKTPVEKRTDLHLSKHDMASLVVIDDTPENRVFLEQTYNAFIQLNNKMKLHFEKADYILNLISTNQKLIG